MNLVCPKCSNEMRSYERNRVLVDQCTGCGGLFLDRGELEQLAAAETAWHAAPAVQDAPRPAERSGYDERRRDDRRYDDRRYEDSRHDSGYRRHKKKSFLSELFDD